MIRSSRMLLAAYTGVLMHALPTSAGEIAAMPRLRASQNEDRQFSEALSTIENHYLTKMTRNDLVERALRLLLRDLDPYSSYLNEQEWAELQARSAAEFGGVGIVMEADTVAEVPRVGRLMFRSAAGAAGVRQGDLIVAVDGRSVRGLSLDEVRPLLMGSPGTSVALTLGRSSSPNPIELRIRRMSVATPSVRGVWRDSMGVSEYLLDEKRGTGYIRIMNLAEDTAPAVEAALTDLERRRMKSLVLDLRSSSGGLMQAAIAVADLFLERGRILTDVSRDETTHYDAHPGSFTDVPMVVLIDAWTASSSEFLAAALHDNGRAIFIGQRTYGKARIQAGFPFDEGGGGLILTTGIFQRPSGEVIDRHDVADSTKLAGVAPDPGMEMLVEGEEAESWWRDTSLLDGAVVLDESERATLHADRILLAACDILESAVERSGQQ